MKEKPLNRSIKAACLTLAFAFVFGGLLSDSAAWGDTVRVGKQPYLGDITKMTPDAVTLKSSSGESNIPTNKITAIRFEDEPREVTQAREAVNGGRFEDAVTALEKFDTKNLKPYIAADAAFYQAAGAAELALRGRTPLNDAGAKLTQFVKDYPDSFHYYEANRLIGDLLVASGKPDLAVAYYINIAKAPWPEYQIDAKIAAASALLDANKTSDAQTLVTEVTASPDLAPEQKVKVELLGVQNLIAQNKLADAIAQLEKLIQATPPEAIDINAQAYNLLGRAYRESNQPQDALLAFLHVDLLYPGSANAHAEALSNLAELWTAEHKPERAELATETLKQRYQYSRWNK